MTFSAVVVAAGSGTRAGPGQAKQWRDLAGKPVLRWSVEALLASGAAFGANKKKVSSGSGLMDLTDESNSSSIGAALMDEATKLARRMAAGPTLSYAAIKQAMNQAATSSLDEQLVFEGKTQKALNATADYKEGVAAFLAKRAANFTGR